MYDENGVCWHQSGRFDKRCRIEHRKLGDDWFYFGRCKSGRRWFWLAYSFRDLVNDLPEAKEAHGLADDEHTALAAARAAIVSMANGNKTQAVFVPAVAYNRLKQINAAKRAARTPSGRKHSLTVEYLYGWRRRYTILKKTKRRIFYLKNGEFLDEQGEPTGESEYSSRADKEMTGFIDRQKFESTAGRDRGRYFYASYAAYAAEWRRHDNESIPDLAALKAAMADAHPDRGGNDAAFIEARRKYVEAKRIVEAA